MSGWMGDAPLGAKLSAGKEQSSHGPKESCSKRFGIRSGLVVLPLIKI